MSFKITRCCKASVCYGLNCAPLQKKVCRSANPPLPVNLTIFGNRVFCRWNQVKMRSFRWACIQHVQCPHTKRRRARDRHTERKPCDDGGRHWSDDVQTKDRRQPQKPRKGRRRLSAILQREHGPTDTLILESSLRNCERIRWLFSAMEVLVICYGGPRK